MAGYQRLVDACVRGKGGKLWGASACVWVGFGGVGQGGEHQAAAAYACAHPAIYSTKAQACARLACRCCASPPAPRVCAARSPCRPHKCVTELIDHTSLYRVRSGFEKDDRFRWGEGRDKD